MDMISETSRLDPVSALLETVRVRSAIYCRSIMGAPWGFGVESHGNPSFHLVTEGSCWLEVDGEPGQIELAAGDFAILPGGPRHWVRDDPDSPAAELEDILGRTPLDEHNRLRFGGTGKKTTLLCGGFELHGVPGHPIIRALPTVVRIRGRAGSPAPWIAASVDLITTETHSEAPGAEAVVNRLAETLLTQSLRTALADTDAHLAAKVRSLQDPQIAAAIELIHRDPACSMSVGELAVGVGLSRSGFAARFREVVGESPKRYLTRCRLVHAATLLQTTPLGLAEIAQRVGYETEYSFSKAFKREFGVAPGGYRGSGDGWPFDSAVAGGDAS